jgi:SAM-dependent methyltransferase
MDNPWLTIPADDYEGHMSSPDVGQLQVLNELFGSVMAELRPASVAVLGCSTGNGFEHITPSVTRRVIGVDINPVYLDILRQRFAVRLPNLALLEGDIGSPSFQIEPVSLIFAGLVFEYVDIDRTLQNITRCLLPGGTLVAALQLPSSESPHVTPTRFASLEALAPIMRLVDVGGFSSACGEKGLVQAKAERVPLKQGKSLFVGYFDKPADSP